jgi:hypothetical protein
MDSPTSQGIIMKYDLTIGVEMAPMRPSPWKLVKK